MKVQKDLHANNLYILWRGTVVREIEMEIFHLSMRIFCNTECYTIKTEGENIGLEVHYSSTYVIRQSLKLCFLV